MEMSSAYMQKTAEFLATTGFRLETETDRKERDGKTVFDRTRFHLRRGEDEHFILESLVYPDGSESYFLEVTRFHRLRSTSFALDSWKFFPDRVEFKYYINPETGMGLSFVLDLGEA